MEGALSKSESLKQPEPDPRHEAIRKLPTIGQALADPEWRKKYGAEASKQREVRLALGDKINQAYEADSQLRKDISQLDDLSFLNNRYARGERDNARQHFGIHDFMYKFPTPEAFDQEFNVSKIRDIEQSANGLTDQNQASILNQSIAPFKTSNEELFSRVKTALYAPNSIYKKVLLLPDVSNKTEEEIKEWETQIASEAPLETNEQIVEGYLSYQDADLPPDKKQGNLEWAKNSPAAQKYTESLLELSKTVPLKVFEVEYTAGKLQQVMLAEAERIGVPMTPYGKSITWAMWDIAKQFYFTKPEHREEQIASGYGEPANPLESETKQDEIINRHLGWEAYAAFRGNEEWREKITRDPKFASALEFLKKLPKPENNTLSSKDLADLGKVLRDVR